MREIEVRLFRDGAYYMAIARTGDIYRYSNQYKCWMSIGNDSLQALVYARAASNKMTRKGKIKVRY